MAESSERTASLVEAAAGGDGQAFVRLVDRFAPAFQAIAARIAGERNAGDVLQIARRDAVQAIADGQGPDTANWYDWFCDIVCQSACRRLSALEVAIMTGDREAFGLWLDPLMGEFRMTAAAHVGDQSAGSVLQGACLRALEALDKGNGPRENCRGWFYKIVINNALNHRAKRARRYALPEDLAAVVRASDGPLSGVVLTEERQHMLETLQDLPEHYREVLQWRYFEDKTWQEIAERLTENARADRTHLDAGRDARGLRPTTNAAARQLGQRALRTVRKRLGVSHDEH